MHDIMPPNSHYIWNSFLFDESMLLQEIIRLLFWSKLKSLKRVPPVGSMMVRRSQKSISLLVGKDLPQINMDRALRSSLDRAACGGLIRDHNGDWVGSFMANLGVCSVMVAKVMGMYHGLRLA
ncbi:hypothetical protein RCOM_0974690 [Ricinus communis]|uniref:Uncharacterized protein n=1 Tax=Ricinus communis TaxID=3988 RepID=B9SXX0_RICCO|nr:hypothetical protein RCOM_0974690 [Ricinus communis]